ncbi:hypothetical protein [Candidatus Allofournierella excrementavium]|uniref:hypothetical protein n=1 Tax=Candidatus Allofournierella excrementavium TaxID=2838591 RepID=UPI003AF6DA56
MKQMKNKIISLSLALALALGVFAGAPVYAEGEETQPDGQTPGTITNTDQTGGGEGGGSTSEPSPTEISIVNYDIGGSFGAHLRPGEKANISITVSDEWAQGKNAGLRGRINTSSFSGKDAIAEKRSDGTYKFVFTDVTYNGGSNEFSFDVITEGGDEPREVQQLTQTIIQCAEAIEPTPAPTPAPAEVPKIMVKDFTFGGNSVEAGKEFTLELTLFTTSGNTNLEDVMVGLTFPTDSKNVSLASGSMNTYVGAMAPNETRTISYKMVTDATMEPGSVNITVQLTSKNGEAATSPISIPVTQPERFEITNVEAPETMMMGEEGYLSVTFVNKGKSAINNLTAEIQGENLANPGQSQFLGNVAAGTENSVDFSVMASAEGVINGKVILSYENSKGEVATLEKEFSCTVEAAPVIDDPGMMDPGMMDPTMGEDVSTGMPIWGWALIVVGVGAVVAVVVVVIRKKKAAKKLAELEDEDEDI